MRRTILALALVASTAPAMAQTPDTLPAAPHGGSMRGAMLMRADTNGDGVVTRDEAMAQSDMRFDRMDGDRDGVVSHDEMRAAREAMRATLRDRRNADGDAPPLPSGARPVGGSPPAMTRDAARARAMAAFDRADTNHDGRIDQAEIAGMRYRRLAPPPVPQQ
ncbi:hypothetical protein [Sphingomonas sp.]|uniref:hypothetical protein n=1 Tax=Sphingomonas sp. TaxID=28214 RepID=UPI0035BBEEBC